MWTYKRCPKCKGEGTVDDPMERAMEIASFGTMWIGRLLAGAERDQITCGRCRGSGRIRCEWIND